jgi:hypothetical protein
MPKSTVDIFGHGWVLLANGPGWQTAAKEVSTETGVPIACYEAGVEFTDPDTLFAARYGLEPGGATLVRPDGVVAWRTPTPVQDAAGTLWDVRGNVLSR